MAADHPSSPAPGRPPVGAGPSDFGDDRAGLWLDDESAVAPATGPGPGRRLVALIGLVVVVALVAVPVGWALASGHGASHHSASSTSTTGLTRTTLDRGPAEQRVLAALSATTDSGSFDVAYTLTGHPGTDTTPSTECEQVQVLPADGKVAIDSGGRVVLGPMTSPGTNPTDTASTGTASTDGGSAPSTTVAPRTECYPAPTNQAVSVTGRGTIDVSPKAMVVGADISAGLDVSVRLDDEDVWESGGADYGLNPTGSSDGVGVASGQSLSGFASLVESTLGPRAGAVAMIGMASPAGYLDLEQASVTGADQVGTATVAGVPVTVYQVSVDPTRLETMPGMSADEVATIQAAVGVLHAQGYTGTTVRVAIDGAGFIRQATSTAAFGDGGIGGARRHLQPVRVRRGGDHAGPAGLAVHHPGLRLRRAHHLDHRQPGRSSPTPHHVDDDRPGHHRARPAARSAGPARPPRSGRSRPPPRADTLVWKARTLGWRRVRRAHHG